MTEVVFYFFYSTPRAEDYCRGLVVASFRLRLSVFPHVQYR